MQFTEEVLQRISKMLFIPINELKHEKVEEYGGIYFKSSKIGRIGADMLVDEDGNYKMIFSRNQKECIEQFKKGKRDGSFKVTNQEMKLNNTTIVKLENNTLNEKTNPIDNSKLIETINNLSNRNDDFIKKQLMRRIRMAKFLTPLTKEGNIVINVEFQGDSGKFFWFLFTSDFEFKKWKHNISQILGCVKEMKFKDFVSSISDIYNNNNGSILIDPYGVNFEIDKNFANEILMDAPGARNKFGNSNITPNVNGDNVENKITNNLNEKYDGMSGIISLKNITL